MKRTRVFPGLEFLEPDSMSNFQGCAGLMIGEKEKVLVDANMGREQTIELIETEKPAAAYISHYHLDHATWAALALELAGAEIFVPSKETRYIEDLDYFVETTAGPAGLADAWREFTVKDCHYVEVREYQTFESPSEVRLGDYRVLAVDTPGHSPGHASLYFPELKMLFTGDMGVDRFGPWYGWADCDLPAQVESTLKLRGLNAMVLLTSHGGYVDEKVEECWNRVLAEIVIRERRIAAALDAGQDDDAIIEEGVYFKKKQGVPEPIRSFLYMWDSFMLDHHKKALAADPIEKLFPELAALADARAAGKR